MSVDDSDQWLHKTKLYCEPLAAEMLRQHVLARNAEGISTILQTIRDHIADGLALLKHLNAREQESVKNQLVVIEINDGIGALRKMVNTVLQSQIRIAPPPENEDDDNDNLRGGPPLSPTGGPRPGQSPEAVVLPLPTMKGLMDEFRRLPAEVQDRILERSLKHADKNEKAAS